MHYPQIVASDFLWIVPNSTLHIAPDNLGKASNRCIGLGIGPNGTVGRYHYHFLQGFIQLS